MTNAFPPHVHVAHPTRVAFSRSLATEPSLFAIRSLTASTSFASVAELRRAIEERIVGRAPEIPDEPVARARECLARAVTATTRTGRDAYVDEALELDPKSADAIRLVADRAAVASERFAALDRAAEAGLERAGGRAKVSSLGGRAWGDVTARPYLRARARRFELLIDAGRDAEAIEEGEALLDLDEGDALGIRHRLGPLHLAAGKPGAYRRLRRRYVDDAAGFFRWGDVLAALLSDDATTARQALAAARKRHRDVGDKLLAPWTLDGDIPEVYEHDQESEILAVTHELYPAFAAHPTALAWLLAETPSVKPRSARMRNLLASLRPGVDQEAEPRWLEWALRAEGRAPDALVRAVRHDGERGVAWVVSLLGREDLDREGAPGKGFGPTTAAALLGELATPSSLPPLIAAFARAEPETALADAVAQAFESFGASALEPLVALLASLPDDEASRDRREDVVGALCSLCIPDDRVVDAALAIFREDAVLGATYLADLRSPRVLAALSDRLDTAPLDLASDTFFAGSEVIEVASAIEEIGGALSPAQARKLQRARDLRYEASERQRAAEGRDDDDDGPVVMGPSFLPADDGGGGPDGDGAYDHAPILSPPSPIPRVGAPVGFDLPHRPSGASPSAGRNDPCPCRSGKKYKKCCWDRDHAAP